MTTRTAAAVGECLAGLLHRDLVLGLHVMRAVLPADV
jgi:hypothetical protein